MSIAPQDPLPRFDPLGGIGVDVFGRPGLARRRRWPVWEDDEPADPDPVVDALRRQWRARLPDLRGRIDLVLDKPVGRAMPNARADVARMEALLHRAGYYDLAGTAGPTGYFGPPQEQALRAAQAGLGLTRDAVALPNGSTFAALSEAPVRRDAEADDEPVAEEAPQPDDGQRAPADRVAFVQGLPAAAGLAAGLFGAAAVTQQEQERRRRAGQMPPAVPRGIDLLDEETVPARTARNKAGFDAQGRAATNNPLRRTVIEDIGPTHTGGPPPGVPDMRLEGRPAQSPDRDPLPPSLRPDANPEDWIEIFPDQAGELPQFIITERKGGEPVRAWNWQVRNWTLEAAGKGFFHSGGSRDSEGLEMAETFLRPKGGGKKGGSFLDVTITNERTKRRLLINTIDTRADGKTPTTREENAAGRIMRNKETGDILVLIPKLIDGQEIDEKAFKAFIEPLLEELRTPHDPSQPGGRFEWKP